MISSVSERAGLLSSEPASAFAKQEHMLALIGIMKLRPNVTFNALLTSFTFSAACIAEYIVFCFYSISIENRTDPKQVDRDCRHTTAKVYAVSETSISVDVVEVQEAQRTVHDSVLAYLQKTLLTALYLSTCSSSFGKCERATSQT